MTKSELIESIARSQKHLPAKDVERSAPQGFGTDTPLPVEPEQIRDDADKTEGNYTP